MNSIPGVTVNHSLITNGSLLSDSLIEVIAKIKNFSVQVTFDGNKTLHDNIRVTKQGEPTYDRIMWAIKLLREKIVVRINVAQQDFLPYKELLVDLENRFGTDITISIVAVFDGQKSKNCPELKHNGDIAELQDYARSLGFANRESMEYAPCVAHARSSFAIDEDLNVYTCPGTLYEKPVGKLNENGRIDIFDNSWYATAFDIPKCVTNCVYGGMCYGGCVVNRKCRKAEFEVIVPRILEGKIERFYQGANS